MGKQHYNVYFWLTDEDYQKQCKEKLVELYEVYYTTTDKAEKDKLFKQLEIYLAVVCDIIAYRYLVKHYTNLFYKLCITVEEYMEYKVQRLLVTIRDKKEHIEDILSYIYMSFMLSSPRLIYDYGEKIGRCQLQKEVLPYYQVARNKFFNNIKEDVTEHVIFNVDTLYLDDIEHNEEFIRSNIDKYSYAKWKNYVRTKEDGVTGYQKLISLVEKYPSKFVKSKEYLLYLLNNWESEIESDYQSVKINSNLKTSYTLLDYIKYKYENKELNLTYEEYIDTLEILNDILKRRK